MTSTSPSRPIDRRMVLVRRVAILALASLVLPAKAFAGGVHFDPESPAGKEYALPLPQARNEASGGGGSGGGGTASAPLFGAGVSSGRGGGESGSGGSAEAGRAERDTRSGAGRPTGSIPSATSPGAPESARRPSLGATVSAAEDSHYPLGRAAWLLAGILLLGAALGFALRALPGRRAGRA